jgi:hypothetical protein
MPLLRSELLLQLLQGLWRQQRLHLTEPLPAVKFNKYID